MEPRSLQINSAGNANNRPLFGSGSSDEDPYSVAGSGGSSGGSSGNSSGNVNSGGGGGGNAVNNVNNRSRPRDKPPKLPPRVNAIYSPSLWAKPGDITATIGKKLRGNNNAKSRGGQSTRA